MNGKLKINNYWWIGFEKVFGKIGINDNNFFIHVKMAQMVEKNGYFQAWLRIIQLVPLDYSGSLQAFENQSRIYHHNIVNWKY